MLFDPAIFAQNVLTDGRRSLALSSLPSDIDSLGTLSKRVELAPGMLDTGAPIEPRLRLFLGNNLFTKVPRPLLDLSNLCELSLRNNRLTSIPPSIRNLKNLQYLNLAGNQLTELPGEVLGLIHDRNSNMKSLILHPNPWKEPKDFPAAQEIHLRPHPTAFGQFRLSLAASMTVDYHDPAQLPLQKSPVPTLTEMVLRKLAAFDNGRTDFVASMPIDSPQAVLDHLEFLRENHDRRCSGCARSIVLASSKHTEWWDIEQGEGLIPAWGPKSLGLVPFFSFRCWKGCGAE
jgi:hypothetical protein